MSGRPILWDVDTQVDFIRPGGKLAVPGAEEAVPAMARLVRFAHTAGIVHVASADDHELTDPEISDTPDLVDTYPPHCLRGTPGAQKIDETAQADPLPLSHVPFPPGLLGRLVQGRRELLLLKKSFDVFTNPSTEELLAVLDPSEVILFGVATDVCNHAAVIGMLRRGRRVTFVQDASRGLSEERTAACLAQWRDAGVTFTTAEAVVAGHG